jgi:hypothetical protein
MFTFPASDLGEILGHNYRMTMPTCAFQQEFAVTTLSVDQFHAPATIDTRTVATDLIPAKF